MSCVKASISEKKRVVGDEGVKDIIQSNIAGIAAGGTRRKLLYRESSEVSITDTIVMFYFSDRYNFCPIQTASMMHVYVYIYKPYIS